MVITGRENMIGNGRKKIGNLFLIMLLMMSSIPLSFGTSYGIPYYTYIEVTNTNPYAESFLITLNFTPTYEGIDFNSDGLSNSEDITWARNHGIVLINFDQS